nr:hypothetical protein [Marasmius tenuissimus]
MDNTSGMIEQVLNTKTIEKPVKRIEDLTKDADIDIGSYNLRKEYTRSAPNVKLEQASDNYSKTFFIVGMVLIVGGLILYNWDSITYYFTNNNIPSNKPDNISDNISSPISDTNNTDREFYFTSPEKSVSSSSTSSTGSSTVMPGSPEPLKTIPLSTKKYNPSFPEKDPDIKIP